MKTFPGALPQAATGLTTQPQQLLGQPQVAPQFILAGQPTLPGQAQGGAAMGAVQQLLIPGTHSVGQTGEYKIFSRWLG